MYVREFGYHVVPGQEEKAVVLCRQFVEALCERGINAYVHVGKGLHAMLHVVEEYLSPAGMYAARAALECDENYRSAVCAWAAEFYPLVQAAIPAVEMHEQERLAA